MGINWLLGLHDRARTPNFTVESACRRRAALGILRDFEKRLEQVVEGFFARALPGGGLQPVELGKRMIRAMEDQKTVSMSATYVPNSFAFRVSPKDHERLSQLGAALERELSTVARRAAATEQWTLLGPPEISLVSDARIAPGTFALVASVREGDDPEAEAGPHTQLIDMSVATDYELIVVGSRKRAYPLSKDTLVVGRLDTCDVVLSDPAASRRHAEVRREGDEWFVVDLGATNRTMVNGKQVSRHRLSPGDRIVVGETEIEFRKP